MSWPTYQATPPSLPQEEEEEEDPTPITWRPKKPKNFLELPPMIEGTNRFHFPGEMDVAHVPKLAPPIPKKRVIPKREPLPKQCLEYQAEAAPPRTRNGALEASLPPTVLGTSVPILAPQTQGTLFSRLVNLEGPVPASFEGLLQLANQSALNPQDSHALVLGHLWLSTRDFTSQDEDQTWQEIFELSQPAQGSCLAQSIFDLKIDQKSQIHSECLQIQAALVLWATNGPIMPAECHDRLKTWYEQLEFFKLSLFGAHFLKEHFELAPISATIRDVEGMLGKIKPITLFDCIARIFGAPTLKQKVAAAVQLFEIYGDFWNMNAYKIETFIAALLQILQKTWSTIKDKYQAFKNVVYVPAADLDDGEDWFDCLEQQADDNSEEAPFSHVMRDSYNRIGGPGTNILNIIRDAPGPSFLEKVSDSIKSFVGPKEDLPRSMYFTKKNSENLTPDFAKFNKISPTISPVKITSAIENLLDLLKAVSIDAYQLLKRWLSHAHTKMIEDPFLTTLICGFVTFLFLLVPGLRGLSFSHKHSVTLLDRLSNALSEVAKAEKLSTSLSKFWDSTSRFVRGLFGVSGDPVLDDFKSKLLGGAEKLQNLLIDIRQNPGKYVNSQREMNFVREAFNKNQELVTSLSKFSDQSTRLNILNPIWNQYNHSYRQVMDYFSSTLNLSSVKQVPAVIWIWGDSNIGKSQLVSTIVRGLSQRHGCDLQVYTRSKLVEYWNGYNGQDIVIFDDFMQIMSENCTDDCDLMNCVTNTSYNLNMADLTSKGMQFTSKYIICLSNQPTIPVNTRVANREAFERRRDLVIHASLPGHDPSHNCQNCGCFPKAPTCPDEDWDFSRHLFVKQPKIVSAHSRDQGMRDAFEKAWNQTKDNQYAFQHAPPYLEHPLDETSNKVVIQKRIDLVKEFTRQGIWGEQTTLDDILDEIAGVCFVQTDIFEHELERLRLLKLKNEATESNLLSPQSEERGMWDGPTKPIVVLHGPAGTGKTKACNMYFAQNPDNNFLHFEPGMLHDQDLPKFFQEHPKLYVEDLSGLADADLKDVGRAVLKVYDLLNPNYKILAVTNPPALARLCELLNIEQDVFLRRSTSFQFSWKMIDQKGFGKFKFGGRLANYTDMQKIGKNDGYSYSQLVSLHSVDLDTIYADVSFSNWLKDLWQPKIIGTVQDCYPIKATTYEARSVFKMNFCIEELMNVVNCNTLFGPAAVAAKILPRIHQCEGNQMTAAEGMSICSHIVRNVRTTGTRINTWREWAYLGASDHLFDVLAQNQVRFDFLDISIGYQFIDTIQGNIAVAVEIHESEQLKSLQDTHYKIHNLLRQDIIDNLFINKIPHELQVTLDAIFLVAKIAIGLYSCSATIDALSLQREIHALTSESNPISNYDGQLGLAKTFASPNPRGPFDTRVQEPNYSFQQEYGESPGRYKKADTRIRPKRVPIPHPRKTRQHEAMVDTTNKQRVMGKINTPKPKQPNPETQQPTRKDKVEKYRNRIRGATRIRDTYLIENSEPGILSAIIQEGIDLHPNDVLSPESCADPNLESVMHSTMQNMVRFVYNNGVTPGHGLMLSGTRGVSFGHVIYGKEVQAHCFRDDLKWNVKWISIDREHDLAIFEITDKRCPSFPKLKCLPTPDDKIAFGKRPAVLLTLPYIRGKLTVCIRSFRAQANVQEELNTGDKYIGFKYAGSLVDHLYPNTTSKGDCGGLLFLVDSTTVHKLVGLHIAGSDSTGFATPLTSALLGDLENESCEPFQTTEPTEIIGICNSAIAPLHPIDRDGANIVGFPLYSDFVPTQSHIQPTILTEYFDKYEVDTQPAILGGNDPRCPEGIDLLWNETIKWTKPPHDLDSSWVPYIERAAEDIKLWTSSTIQQRIGHVKVLTKKEAINGVTHLQNSKPINFKSSAGFPFTQRTNDRGKHGFFVYREDLNTHDLDMDRKEGRYLNACIDRLIHRSKNLEPLQLQDRCIWKVFLKDEPLKLDKIDPPRTRSVAGAPLDFTLAMRMYTHEAVTCLVECHEDFPLKIGLNVHSLDWHVLATQMLAVSEEGTDLDFKGWDFNTLQCLFPYVADIYSNIYRVSDPNWKKEDDTIRQMLYQQMQEGLVLSGDKIYQVTSGLLSGQPNTAPDNCIINWLMCLAIYYRVMEEANEQRMATFTAFMQNVSLAVYGDDFLATIRKDIQHLFNGVILQQKYAEFGMEATPADKSSTMQPVKPFDELQFLSRGFVRTGHYWTGPLKMRSIRRTVHWHHGQTSRSRAWFMENNSIITSFDSIVDIKDSILPELYLHGKEEYEYAVQCFKRVFNDLDENVHLPSFHEAESLFAPWNQ